MVIERLVWDDWNLAHILKHGCTVDDVEYACLGAFVLPGPTYKGRSLIGGEDKAGRIVEIVVGPDPTVPGSWYPFGAWPADRKERPLYDERIKQRNNEIET